MKCIVGLGNPGLKYKHTRHNIGFDVIDYLAKQNGWKLKKGKFEAHYAVENWQGEKVLILKPQTFMNLSGQSVRQAMDFYDIEPENLLVVYDDLDLPTGKIRLRHTGGHGGHNGIRNIIEHLGVKEFNRVRFGIGRPETNIDIVHYVLSKFSKQEKEIINPSIMKTYDACEAWMETPFAEVMNKFN
uniref:aminoacyl-tRNA hydrolase n=1 Tax=uncultured Allobacillus sp. TaxID=1638025 RepID=UPI002592AA12|nr:aminoacyl-tRNA hydrolase [uncultured Allobacillus sp.]